MIKDKRSALALTVVTFILGAMSLFSGLIGLGFSFTLWYLTLKTIGATPLMWTIYWIWLPIGIFFTLVAALLATLMKKLEKVVKELNEV